MRTVTDDGRDGRRQVRLSGIELACFAFAGVAILRGLYDLVTATEVVIGGLLLLMSGAVSIPVGVRLRRRLRGERR